VKAPAGTGRDAPRLRLFSPAGVLREAAALRRAERRLAALGFAVERDDTVLARAQRFAGADEVRLAALHRTAAARPAVALATRGGYGLARVLPAIDWKALAASIEAGTRWCGYSDCTLLQLGLLRHLGAKAPRGNWAGPLAASDFGRPEEEGGLDDVTRDVFAEAMDGRLEGIGFRTEPGFDGLAVRGRLWGGNLAVLCSMLGTPWWPPASVVRGGVLWLEEVGEHPYRVERGLLQLHAAGVIDTQRAVLVGAVSDWKPSPNDHGYRLRDAIAALRARSAVPVLTGLPFGHVQPKVCLPQGAAVELGVAGRDALLAWGHG
jgi:muramoyltetrapeptide carboxypeptidase